MSEHIQKKLSQLVKTQLEKKSSKKNPEKTRTKKHDSSKEELAKQKQKMSRNQEIGAKVSEEERWAMYRRLILEKIARFLMISFYVAVATVACFKFGTMLIALIHDFFRGIFVTTPPITPKS